MASRKMTPTMRKALATALATLLIAFECGAAEYAEGANHFATFFSHRSSAHTGCAVSDAFDLDAGQAVTIVILSKPQRIASGTIASKSPVPCAELARSYFDGTFYEVKLDDAAIGLGDLGILVAKKATPDWKVVAGRVTARFGGMSYTFDECASHEGIHLTVRASGRRTSRLVWHDYMYLDYGTEPSCGDRQYDAIDSLVKSFHRGAQKRAP
jgi:hypothetical protein